MCVCMYLHFMQGHCWIFINSFSDMPIYFVIPALAQTVWAQHAMDNLRPFVIITPTRNYGSKNWLVSGWHLELVGESFVPLGVSSDPQSGTHCQRGHPVPVSDCAFVTPTAAPAQINIFEPTVPFLSMHFVASIVRL